MYRFIFSMSQFHKHTASGIHIILCCFYSFYLLETCCFQTGERAKVSLLLPRAPSSLVVRNPSSWFCCCLVDLSCLTLLRPHGPQPAGLLCPWDFPVTNIGVGCPFLLRGSSHPSIQTQISFIARWILHHWTTGSPLSSRLPRSNSWPGN